MVLIKIKDTSDSSGLFIHVRLTRHLSGMVRTFLKGGAPRGRCVIVLIGAVFFNGFLHQGQLAVFGTVKGRVYATAVFFLGVLPRTFTRRCSFVHTFRYNAFSRLRVYKNRLTPFNALPIGAIGNHCHTGTHPVHRARRSTKAFNVVISRIEPNHGNFRYYRR